MDADWPEPNAAVEAAAQAADDDRVVAMIYQRHLVLDAVEEWVQQKRRLNLAIATDVSISMCRSLERLVTARERELFAAGKSLVRLERPGTETEGFTF